ncbi:FAD-dependent oxidoreductase [Enterocloster clostridioformis]|uniref:FAD-dependent oxidoreductase n=1 Tax=Enterocloster clostridioformis TaxID=1531 RepID=UPI00041E934F|nr:FAD-dependent oxidoreductase [Enterocloster clostridioformis]
MTDGRVTVIGGGLTGLETAEYLYNHNMTSEVRIVDMLPQFGAGMYPVIFMDIMKQLTPHNPVMMPGHKIIGLEGKSLKLLEIATEKTVEVESGLQNLKTCNISQKNGGSLPRKSKIAKKQVD